MTYITFFATGALVLILFLYFFGGRKASVDGQLVAERRIPYPFVGLWCAVAFTWGATFFYSGQLAYQYGSAGIAWYILGNGGGLVLAMLIMRRIPAADGKYSIAEAMGERFGSPTRRLYALSIAGVQSLYALPLQFIAAGSLLNFTMGANKTYTILAAAAAMIVPVLWGGIRSSAVVDVVKGAMMIGLIFVLAPIAIIKGGGLEAVVGGLSGSSPTSIGFFGLAFTSAGIPILVSLLSAGPIDQSLYQRFFSAQKSKGSGAKWPFVLGAAFFVANILAAASLGFLAANPSLGISVATAEAQRIAGFVSMNALVPTLAIFFIVTVIAAFVASGDSALNASSSIWASDVYKGWWRTGATEDQVIRVQRYAMIAFIVAAAGIALTGVSMLTLTIAVGVFRSALFVPTILGFFVERSRIPDVLPGILVAMASSVLLYGAGRYCGQSATTLGTAGAAACSQLPFFPPLWYELAGSLAGWVVTALYSVAVVLRPHKTARQS